MLALALGGPSPALARRLCPRQPRAAGWMGPPSALIEVERKFEAALGADALESAVGKHGGAMLGSVRFTDSYFDTSDCALTRTDTWLRRRDLNWELKVPVGDDARRSCAFPQPFIRFNRRVLTFAC